MQMWNFSDLLYNSYIYNVYFKVKTEQKRKTEENFNEWKELKNKDRQQWKQKQQEKKNLENKAQGHYR